MINIEEYISKLIVLLEHQFGSRLLYVGLQGSYLRGEATDSSDIDVMVVIDDLSVPDLSLYRSIIECTGHPDKSCGFICSKSDLANWNPLEIFHLSNGTKDYLGSLAELVPSYTKDHIREFVKLSLNNLYHEICHRYIYSPPEKNIKYLPSAYKSVFFILQNLYYLENGKYVATKAELLSLLDGIHRTVLERSIELNSGSSYNFSDSFALLFTWCQTTLQATT